MWSIKPAAFADRFLALDIGHDGIPRLLLTWNIFQTFLVEDVGGTLISQDIINGSLPGMAFDYGKDMAVDVMGRVHVSLYATGPTPSLVYGVRNGGT